MSKYTVELAKLELEKLLLKDEKPTLDDIRNIISNLDVADSKANIDAKTILYSGVKNKGDRQLY